MNSYTPQREAQFIGSLDRVPTTPMITFLHLTWKVSSHLCQPASNIGASPPAHHCRGFEEVQTGSGRASSGSPNAATEPPHWLQVNSLFFGALAFVTPLRFHLPLQFFFLLLKLRSSAARCLLECGVPATQGGPAWPSGVAPEACLAAPIADACSGAAAAERYYSNAIGWIRRAVPFADGASAIGRTLPASWRLGNGGCLAGCYAVHGWMQVRLCLPTCPPARLPACLCS